MPPFSGVFKNSKPSEYNWEHPVGGEDKQVEYQTSYSPWISLKMETVSSCDVLVPIYHPKGSITQKTGMGNITFRTSNIIPVEVLDCRSIDVRCPSMTGLTETPTNFTR
jgi:hypothetical protein